MSSAIKACICESRVNTIILLPIIKGDCYAETNEKPDFNKHSVLESICFVFV